MRILLALYPIDDMGGIINHTENLMAGFRDNGNEVDIRLFLPREDYPRNGVAGGRETLSSITRMYYDQRKGYTWPRELCVPYRGLAKRAAIALIESYDLVVWQIAVPTKRKENRGNKDWLDLYDTSPAHIAVIHDGNFLGSYPWLSEVAQHLNGLACVHHCALNSAKNISVPSALILNPQRMDQSPDITLSAFERRRKGFLSVQTWKAWKHVPELLEALPYAGDITKWVGGCGIDYYYLTSQDKCKWPGVWNRAEEANMEYVGVLTNSVRDNLLREVTCLMDPSWSKKYSAIGGHFNRVMIDAIKQGAVPIARPAGIGGELFISDVNCVTIPMGATPYEYGGYLNAHCTMDYNKYLPIIQAGLQLVPLFDRQVIASQFIQMARGDLSTHTGVTSAQVKADSQEAMVDFFGSTDDAQA